LFGYECTGVGSM